MLPSSYLQGDCVFFPCWDTWTWCRKSCRSFAGKLPMASFPCCRLQSIFDWIMRFNISWVSLFGGDLVTCFTKIPKYPRYFCHFTCYSSYNSYRPAQGMRKRQWLPWHPSPTLIPTQWVSTPTPWTLPTLIPTPSVSIQTLLALIPMLSVLIRKMLGMNFGQGFCWFVFDMAVMRVLNMQVHEFDPHCPMKEAARVSRCLIFWWFLHPLRGHLRKLRGLPSIRGPWRDLSTAGGDTGAEAGACGLGLDVLGAGASAYAGGTGATGWDGMDVTSGWGWVAEMYMR